MKITSLVVAMLVTVTLSTIIPPGLYKITCVATGDSFDMLFEETSDGTDLILFFYHDGAHEQFTVSYVDGPWATLVAHHSGKALTANSNASGDSFTQQTITGDTNQQFKFLLAKDGNYLIKNRASGLVLNCNSDAQSDYGFRLVIQESKSCTLNEKFTLTKLN